MREFRLGSACVLILTSLALPAVAQSQRYPTDAEIQDLAEEFKQAIPELQNSGFYNDYRTPEEQQEISAYKEAWAVVDPEIAPFLGEWIAIEESLYIYPSSIRGEVCILDVHLIGGTFYSGQVQNGKIYTDSNLVFILENNFLGSTFVTDEPGIYEYAHPRPLKDPSKELGQYLPEAVAAFEEAGCLVSLPQ